MNSFPLKYRLARKIIRTPAGSGYVWLREGELVLQGWFETAEYDEQDPTNPPQIGGEWRTLELETVDLED